MRRMKNYFQTEEGSPAPLTVEIERVLRFSEVDALAIAWHGRYPAFFEDAHTELMRKIHLTYQEYKKHNLGAPIVQLHVDYYKPLLLDEKFRVRASLFWNDGARLNVSYAVFDETGALAATGYTVQMFFDLSTHEPVLVTPPILEECRGKWREGEFR